MDITKTKNNTQKLQPYDDTLMEPFSFYENFPYICDDDLCNEMGITLVSGNIIKSNQCFINKPYEIKH
jgi:hypothetical protein